MAMATEEYGVRHILGITAGYNGLSDPVNHPPVELTEKMVRCLTQKTRCNVKGTQLKFAL